MSQNKNALLRYKIIDRCLNNTMKEYTFKDLKEEVDRVLLEKFPNYNGISEHQLRVDIRFMMSSEGYEAPIIQKIPGTLCLIPMKLGTKDAVQQGSFLLVVAEQSVLLAKSPAKSVGLFYL